MQGRKAGAEPGRRLCHPVILRAGKHMGGKDIQLLRAGGRPGLQRLLQPGTRSPRRARIRRTVGLV